MPTRIWWENMSCMQHSIAQHTVRRNPCILNLTLINPTSRPKRYDIGKEISVHESCTETRVVRLSRHIQEPFRMSTIDSHIFFCFRNISAILSTQHRNSAAVLGFRAQTLQTPPPILTQTGPFANTHFKEHYD